MLPVRNYKKCLIKPLPLEKFTKTKHPTNKPLFGSFGEDSNCDHRSVGDVNKRRHSLPEKQITESPLDYTIDDSEDEDDLSMVDDRRKSFSSVVQRTITPPSNLKDLLKASSLDFVKKRKRKQPASPCTPLSSLPTKVYVGIDESSPVKKAKSNQYVDQSTIFISRGRRLDKISPKNKRLDMTCNDANIQTLEDQMRRLAERDRTARTIWRHSVTSQLKNKFKKTINGKDTLTLRLYNFDSKIQLSFADGKIMDTTVESNYAKGEKLSLILPSAVCENMGLFNGTVVKFFSPWNVINLSNQRYIINPFWISIIERFTEKKEDAELAEKEVSIFEWKCPCRQGLGTINSYLCNQALSQQSQCASN